jgi:hypothetical protein
MIGYYLLFSPIVTLLSWIPLIGGLLSWIVGFAAAIIAFLAGSLTFLLVFALAWIRYRPLIGIAIFALIGAVIVGLTI